MSKVFTLDASVFTNACNRNERDSETSQGLLLAIRESHVPLIEPTLMFVEVAAALKRGRGDAQLARVYAETLFKLPHLTVVSLDQPLAREALNTAAEHSLRGSDAVYAATAFRYGANLVTLDIEQRQRATPVVDSCTPREAIEMISATKKGK